MFFHLCEKWRGNNFVIKPFSSILLVSEFLFSTKNISCFIEHHFTPENTVVIMTGGFWFWPQSQLSFQTIFDHSFQSSLLCIITTWIFALQHISYKLLRAQFQRPLHRRNWAPPNIIAIIPCANVAEMSNNLIFLYMNLKSRTSPSWYFDVNLNSNEVTNFHVSWERDGTVRHALEWRKSIYKS